MDQKIFAELLESANEALEHAKGKRELRTTELPPPPKPVDGGGIRRLRTRLKMSQAVFARYLNVSTKLVQAWESDRSEEHTSELQSLAYLVCRLLLEKKKKQKTKALKV